MPEVGVDLYMYMKAHYVFLFPIFTSSFLLWEKKRISHCQFFGNLVQSWLMLNRTVLLFLNPAFGHLSHTIHYHPLLLSPRQADTVGHMTIRTCTPFCPHSCNSKDCTSICVQSAGILARLTMDPGRASPQIS